MYYLPKVLSKIIMLLSMERASMTNQNILMFFLLGFTPCKAEQPLQGMKLQRKEWQKD